VVSVTPQPRFTPGERTTGTHCTGGWVGPRAGLDTQVRETILSPRSGIETQSFSLYSDTILTEHISSAKYEQPEICCNYILTEALHTVRLAIIMRTVITIPKYIYSLHSASSRNFRTFCTHLTGCKYDYICIGPWRLPVRSRLCLYESRKNVSVLILWSLSRTYFTFYLWSRLVSLTQTWTIQCGQKVMKKTNDD
jgi:hypothetical protein